MIKTNIDKPAKPEVPLIILGVLKGILMTLMLLWRKQWNQEKK
ncbi:hypothetical protein [Clostridium estertheticum]|nr:hypothetical protein [Clostridium estertheticum]